MFAHLEIGLEPKILLDFFFDSGNRFGLGEFKDRLGVIRYRAVGIDRDIDRAHAEKAVSDKAESENRGVRHNVLKPRSGDQEGPQHKPCNQYAFPKRREVSRHKAREDRERCAAFA
ncbi:MAG: hypothetical protein BWY42_01301 [Candidatus Omnitrophica bacterium ADurb.Bin277]|nr:MAG: hypothetical protein BWY42_01301 [Candidatus Omnitrophica bacterium ADurb.Bin277]